MKKGAFIMKKRILAALLLAGLMLAATSCVPERSKYEIVTNEHGEAVTDEKGEVVTKEKDKNDDQGEDTGHGGFNFETDDPDAGWSPLIPLN